MSLMSIFNGKEQWKPTVIPITSHRKSEITNTDALDSHLDVTSTSIATGGTDYVEDYVKEEEEKILAYEKSLHGPPGKPGDNFEEISQATAAFANPDLQTEELTKIYKTYSFKHRLKENLTITPLESKIVSMIETNRVTIIQGPTGCGKTTQVPQFILDSCVKKRMHCNIIVTQPRRIAAISIAKRVSQERNWPVGTLVGYQVGMVKNTSQDTRLTYCTTGVLLQRLVNSKNMFDYTHVIIDEVHERDQNMDFLLLVVRKLQRMNSRHVRVILMSATFNVDKFATYFSIPIGGKLVPAPIIDIAKRNFFNIQVHYLCQITTIGRIPEVSAEKPQVTTEMMQFCVRIISVFDTIDKDSDHRYAVLVFLPGIFEIEEMHDLLTNEANEKFKCDVVVLHSSITNEEQQRVFDNPPKDYRRIILATNIAESSVTLPDIKYVIDFCLTKQLVTDPKTNFQCLEIEWASKANCEQRAGRAGRLMDGRVYRMVPKCFYENIMLEEGSPEMIRAPLENVVLNAKILEMGEPKAILALSLDPPDLSNLERTILLLKEAGALLDADRDNITPLDGELTDLGRIMAALPIDIHISKLIVLGHVFSVLSDAIIMGASMAVKNMFSAPFSNKLRAYSAKLAMSMDSESDCISFLKVFNFWNLRKGANAIKGDASEKQWARTRHLQIKVLREIEHLVRDLTKRLERFQIVETTGPLRVTWNAAQKPLILKIIIAGAFYPNYYTRCVNTNETDGIRALGGLDPTKTVYLLGWPINQPGALYARRIQEHFRECVVSRVGKILVSFDNSTKVYVQFRKYESSGNKTNEFDNDSTEEPGEISRAVYKAMKLRTIGAPITIPLMNYEIAQKKAEELGIAGPVTQVFIPKEGPIERPRSAEFGIRPILPALDITCIPLVVRKVVTAGHFWAQLKDVENQDNLRHIESTIDSRDIQSLNVFEQTPKIGTLVLAPHRRKDAKSVQYFRAIVQNLSIAYKSDLLAKVLYVDYGYFDSVRVSDLREIDESLKEIMNIPALAFECVLAGICPSAMSDIAGRWSKSASEEFYKILEGDVSIFGEIYSVVNSVIHLKLLVKKNEETINVNEHLVKLGYAENREEDYLSQCNHELRQRVHLMPLRQREHHEELQYDQGHVSDTYPEAPKIEECASSVTLRGPFSPLEIGLRSLTKSGAEKRIKIDHSSVNCVVLDTNPDDPHDRLMIAGSVSQSPSGHSLSLRNTTLMPNIPGLTSILCLLFAPQIELRRNFANSRYIGALCGLGYLTKTENSIFPEHDLSVNFDVDITMDDLQDVNRLRHWMSVSIYRDDDNDNVENAKQTASCQNRVKDLILSLIEKRRVSVQRENVFNSGHWCLYPPHEFIRPGKIPALRQNLYRLHNALELDERNDEEEQMIEHAKELRNLSDRHYRNEPIGDVTCKFCSVILSGVYQLRIHLCTLEHKAGVAKYPRLVDLQF